MKGACLTGDLPAVATELAAVRLHLAVSPAVSEQGAAVDGGVRTLSTPERLLTWAKHRSSFQTKGHHPGGLPASVSGVLPV